MVIVMEGAINQNQTPTDQEKITMVHETTMQDQGNLVPMDQRGTKPMDQRGTKTMDQRGTKTKT
jgi:hypothetical protein